MKEIIIIYVKKILIIIYKFINRKKCVFKSKSIISNKTELEGNNVLGKNTNVSGTIVGYSTYISNNSEIINSKIGKFSSIGNNVRIIAGAHPTRKFVTTSPLFYSVDSVKMFKVKFTDKKKFEEFKYIDDKYYIDIGNDVWIGDNVSIMQGVKINDGAIIGANSLVTKDIPAYSICVGTPAKVLKYRFSKEEIEQLIKIQWWYKDKKWINDNKEFFEDIDIFLEKNKNDK